MHPAIASGTPLCLFLEFQPTHGLLDKFRDNSPTRVFLSDRCGALYKDSYVSERLVHCLRFVCCFDACMLLILKRNRQLSPFVPALGTVLGDCGHAHAWKWQKQQPNLSD